MKKLVPALMALMLFVAHFEVEAKRMGGGKSFGRQSSNVTQREATPPAAPAAPTQNAAAARPGSPARFSKDWRRADAVLPRVGKTGRRGPLRTRRAAL